MSRVTHLNKSGSGMASMTACGRNILRTPISCDWEGFKLTPKNQQCEKCAASKQFELNERRVRREGQRMSELTKGPWKAKRLATYQEPGWVVLWPDKGGTHMRRLDSNGNFTGPDAALIAAAHELLAAAKKVNALSIQTEAHKELRAAIAKATKHDA